VWIDYDRNGIASSSPLKSVCCIMAGVVAAMWPAAAVAGPVAIGSVIELRRGSFTSDVTLAGYLGTGTPGGGLLHYDASDVGSTDNGCTIFQDSAGHRFKRAPDPLPVTFCGARGDGVADDTEAEQLALSLATMGGNVIWPISAGCYRTTATLSVNRSLTLKGRGKVCGKTPGISLFSVTASKVTFDGLALTGPQSAIYHGGEHAVLANGIFHPGKAPQNIVNFIARNLIISSFGGAGVELRYVDGFEIAGNEIHDMCYAGIEGLSVQHGSITDNVVSNVSGRGSPGENAYGIVLSRYTDDSGELISQPRSANVKVSNNRISDIPTWEGLDTHAGSHISFIGNTVSNSFYGISVGSSRAGGHAGYVYAPLEITVFGNRLDSGVVDGSRGSGIPFTGTPTEDATGTIAGNSIVGYGNAATAADGAIRTYYTKGLAITDNVIVNPSPNGIAMVNGSSGTIITRNTIRDPFTNAASVGSVQGIYTTGDNNSPVIESNRIMHAGKVANYLLNSPSGAAIRLGPGHENVFIIGSNNTNATFPLLNPGNTPVRRRP